MDFIFCDEPKNKKNLWKKRIKPIRKGKKGKMFSFSIDAKEALSAWDAAGKGEK